MSKDVKQEMFYMIDVNVSVMKKNRETNEKHIYCIGTLNKFSLFSNKLHY